MTARKQKQGPAPRLQLTDTTFRDGNQALLGGKLLGEEIYPIARKMDTVGFFAMEAFGGATFESYLRLGGDPWDHLRRLHRATPNTPIQALIRGQNLVGHRNYADDTVELFVRHAAKSGVDVFRVFDPLNDIRNMEVAIDAAKKAGKRVQGALSYAISPVHDVDLWCSLAKGLAGMGVDDIVVKDTSGLLSPQVTWELVTALRDTTGLPLVVHSHCSSGMAPMAYMAAVEAGATIVDTAMSPFAWGASQPATESVVAALAGGDYDTGLDLERLVEIKSDLEQLKRRHLDDVSPYADRVDSDILRYRMPGFMLEDIHRQLQQHEAGARAAEVLSEVGRVREELGYPPLVAPIRQLIASQAVFNVIGSGGRYATVTQELKDYLQGLYGSPPRPADSEIRRQVLGREEPITIRPADLLEAQVAGGRSRLRKQKVASGDDQVLTYIMFPDLALELERNRKPARTGNPKRKQDGAGADKAGLEDGREPGAGAEPEPGAEPAAAPGPAAAAEPGPAQAAEFDVEVDGEVFKVRVSGAGMMVGTPGAGPATSDAAQSPAATASPRAGAVLAPMQGLIVKLPVGAGDEVKLGDVVAVLEAMKMQNDIVATQAGKVSEVYVREGEVVSPNQAILAVG